MKSSCLAKEQLIDMYRKMFMIRKVELKISELFIKGLIPGTIHLYHGEEAVAVGAVSCLRKEDVILTTHRPHGHAIAKGIDIKRLLAEILGREGGCSKGKGGSMHIVDVRNGLMPSLPIIGAGIPIAAGVAFSFKKTGKDNVVVSFFGDGTSNIGAFHEGINLAAIWNLPVIYVIENNLYAVSTRIKDTCKLDDISKRAASYGIQGITVDGNDVREVHMTMKNAVEKARSGEGPTLIECKTYRHGGHSRTDPGVYRSKEEVAAWMEKDPIRKFRGFLIEEGFVTEDDCSLIEGEVDAEVAAAAEYAVASPEPSEKIALEDVL